MKHAPGKPARVATRELHPLAFLADALHESWSRHLKRGRRCRAKFTRKTVHRSRVQIRRLIALLGLMPGFVPAGDLRKARRMLKRHHALTRDLRDAQVGLKNVKRLAGELPAAAAFAEWMRKRSNRLGRRARRALARGTGKRLARLVESIEARLRRQAAGLTAKRAASGIRRNVDRAFERVIGRDRRVDRADATTIHRTRVALKRFAYMTEAVAPLQPGLRAGPRGVMRDFMSAMGSIQDNEVLLAALVRFERKTEARGGSVVTLRAELVRRRTELVDAYLKTRAVLGEFKPKGPAA